MYKIELISDYEPVGSDTRVIHDPANGVFAMDAQLVMELNTAGTLTFRLDKDHGETSWLRSNLMAEGWYVYVYRDGSVIWQGRVARATSDRIGGFTDFECEGLLSLLADMILFPYSFSGTPTELIDHYVNDLVPQCYALVNTGNVTVTDPNNYIVRSNQDYTNAWDEISAKTCGSSLGGYLQVRHTAKDNNLYIDWLDSVGSNGTQQIKAGVNLLELKDDLDATTIMTGVLAYGKEKADVDPPEYTNLVGYPGTIATGYTLDANMGILYKDSLVTAYGKRVAIVRWPDIGLRDNLYSAARWWLPKQATMERAFTIRAVDLHDVDGTIPALELGCGYVLQATGVNQRVYVIKMSLDLLHPESSTYDFDKYASSNISSGGSAGGASTSIGTNTSSVPYIYRKTQASSVHSDETDGFTWWATLDESDVSIMTPNQGEPNIYISNNEGHSGIFGHIGIKQWMYYPGNSTSESPYSMVNLYGTAVNTRAHYVNINAYSGSNQLGYTGEVFMQTTKLRLMGVWTDTAEVQADGGFWIEGEGSPRNADNEPIPYPAVFHNGTNMWIGAEQTATKHHIGGTYISAGYDSSNSKGYPSIYVSVPNASNTGATNYEVWHKGNLPASASEESTISDIITAASGVTVSAATFRKWGKFAQLNVSWKKSSAIAADATSSIGTVKSGYRPIAIVAGGNANVSAHLNAAGALTVRNITGASMASNTTQDIAFVYMVS